MDIGPVLRALDKYPHPGLTFEYGTAGFRYKANVLDRIVFLATVLAVLRSKRASGATVGIMITASHNPAPDNGVKIVDPLGEMLDSSWEGHATVLANAKTTEEVKNALIKIAEATHPQNVPAKIIFAKDTRASGPHLGECLMDACKATDTTYTDYGLLTTPQLHSITRAINGVGTVHEYGEPSEEGYYKKLAEAFKQAIKHRKSKGPVTVDCANGVGAPKLRELLKYIPSAAEGGIDVKVVNEDITHPDSLNYQCGADFVKTNRRAPPSSKAGKLDRCASFDGDADRIVYYYVDNDNKFRLLDGDRIASLAASFISDQLKVAGLTGQIEVGVVQTAYANGASTEHIEKYLGLKTICTNTGVKHLHAAANRFDIGVYFEANGHGTVLFSPNAMRTLRNHKPQSPGQLAALETVLALRELINQTTGDALADLLLVEVVLAQKNWTVREWFATYTDIPNRLEKLVVPNRRVFVATDAERKLESPPGVQKEIDRIVGLYWQGRSFVRPSGTEDVVRVYGEARSDFEVEDMMRKVLDVVAHAADVAAGGGKY